jgi:type I restriction enzyme S subunit
MREMKHSGIEWIGEIPKDWDKGHLKYYTQIKTGGTPSTSNQVWFDGDVLWFTPGDFDNILLNDSKRKLSNLAVLFRVANLFPANTTMIVGIGGTAGKVGYTIKESYCNQQITALINKSNTYPKYITYLMFCFSDVLKDNALYTTLPILNNQFIGNFSICIPKKLSEQRKIADYLDTKCSEIDATAEDIKKEISLLEDYKTSVITEAVTKGLNPDVEMKDSGIEYIGITPIHWNKYRLKYILLERNIRTITGEEMLLSVSQYKGVVPSKDIYNRTMQANSLIGYKIVKKDDLVFNKLNPGLARFGNSEFDGITSPDFSVYIVDDKKCTAKFLQHLLKTYKYVAKIKGDCTGVGDGFARLYSEQLYRFVVSLPPIEELHSIVAYIDSKCSEIDTLIADKKRQLDILADYKKSLIYEYVTGKKEVPVKDF